MPIGGRLVGGGRGGQSGGRRVSVCMRAYVSRFGGGGWVNTDFRCMRQLHRLLGTTIGWVAAASA